MSPDVLQADLGQAAIDDLEDLVLALVGVLAQREGDVVEQVHRAEERAVLEEDAELLAHLEQLVVVHVGHRLAVDQDVALVGVQQPDHVLDAHRLAGARGPEDHRDLPLGDAHVQAAQDLVAPEGLVHVDELDGVGDAGRAVQARVPAELVVVGALGLVDHRHALGLARVARRSLLVAAQVLLAQRAPRRARRRSVARHPCIQPPIGARGFAPQNSCVPSIPMRCTSTMLSTIDFAVAVPTPTGPPLAL